MMTINDITDVIREADSLARQHRTRHAVVDRTGRLIAMPWADVRPHDVVLESIRPPITDNFGRRIL